MQYTKEQVLEKSKNITFYGFEYYEQDIEGNIVSEEFEINSSEYFKDTYKLQARLDIFNTLLWAEQNPNFHFESIMKDAPVVGELKFSNEEVYQYLMSFKAFMKQEEYKLLIEDRELKKPEDYI